MSSVLIFGFHPLSLCTNSKVNIPELFKFISVTLFFYLFCLTNTFHNEYNASTLMFDPYGAALPKLPT